MLLFADESEALTHPYLARAWAKRGADLRVPAPGQAKKAAMMGALDHLGRRLVVHTSKTKRSADFIALLQRLDGLYGPRPGLPITPVVMVLDNGPIHVSKATTAALGARAHWLTVEWLPKYAPELRTSVSSRRKNPCRPGQFSVEINTVLPRSRWRDGRDDVRGCAHCARDRRREE